MKKLLFACIAVLMGNTSAFAQEDVERGIFNHVGLNVSASTEGIGVGVATPITDYLELSAGVNFMPSIKVKGDVNVGFNIPAGYDIPTDDKVKITGDFKRTTFDVKLNVYPFGGKSTFFIAGGLSFGGEKMADLTGHSDVVSTAFTKYGNDPIIGPLLKDMFVAELDKYDIKFDDKGDVNGDIRVKNVRPYVGLGFGRLVPQHRVGFRFEAGCQFMGKMEVYQNDKIVDIRQYNNTDDDLSKIIDKWTVYPVLKLTITGRIF